MTILISAVLVLNLSSCSSSPIAKNDSTNFPTTETTNTPLTNQLESTPTPVESQTPIVSQPDSTPASSALVPRQKPVPSQPLTTGTKATTTTQAQNTISLNIYQADSQCQTLVPEKVAVPARSPVDAAVGKVLEKASSGDFDLAGYRVNVNFKSGVATVDLRLAPDAQRQFLSLSTCEQFALFGSLRKTLVDNAQLKIKDVRFTEQGQDLEL
ncbi:MAG: sporulation/spore germination protein [Microcoleus sp. SIO2G3]|nr:sporulation/spore germination protein [Microcoleus sp. SIO2G3]